VDTRAGLGVVEKIKLVSCVIFCPKTGVISIVKTIAR
jgi:hypothetical protein